MPSIIPSYVYTLFASIAVGSLLIVTFSLSTLNIRSEVEEQQLASLAEYVAAKSCELVSTATTDRISINSTLHLPSLVGNQKYWVRLASDSVSAWVDVGYGATPLTTQHKVLIPAKISAQGIFTGGSSSAILQCYVRNAVTYIILSGGT